MVSGHLKKTDELKFDFLEALAVIQILITQNTEIQKIFAFGAAFEKLMGLVSQEGGIEGSIVVQESLTCVDTLLRFNVSNQVRQQSAMPTVCSFSWTELL
jgi:hypothetical protein